MDNKIKVSKYLRLRKQVNPPNDTDWIYCVEYKCGSVILAGCGMTEIEAMTNFCSAYLRKNNITSNKNAIKN